MDALIFIGLAAVIAIAVVWSRVGLARSEKRSMRSYKHTLEVLGDVSRRSDKAAPITPLTAERATFGHIRTERPGPTDAAQPAQPAQPSPPRIDEAGRFAPRLQRPVPRARLEATLSEANRFEDDSDAFERIKEEEEKETRVPFSAGPASVLEPAGPSEPPTDTTPPRPARRRPPAPVQPAWGRIGSVAAVIVILVGLVFVGIHLASNNPKGSATATTLTGPSSSGQRRHHHRSKPPATTTPSALVPISTSSTDVAFVAPKGSYTVQLNDTGGTCWVGIQQTSGGPYVWQETLSAGQSASYKATGPLVVRIGAPKFLGVKVNGIPARLPGYVQPYDLTFNPSSPPSSA
jgi:hypothetical protein